MRRCFPNGSLQAPAAQGKSVATYFPGIVWKKQSENSNSVSGSRDLGSHQHFLLCCKAWRGLCLIPSSPQRREFLAGKASQLCHCCALHHPQTPPMLRSQMVPLLGESSPKASTPAPPAPPRAVEGSRLCAFCRPCSPGSTLGPGAPWQALDCSHCGGSTKRQHEVLCWPCPASVVPAELLPSRGACGRVFQAVG